MSKDKRVHITHQEELAGETVVKTSTTDSGHSHTFSIEVPDS